MDDLHAVVVAERDDDDLPAVAAALSHALGAAPDAPDEPGRGAPIALPLGAEAPPRLRDAELAVVLDPDADELARHAGVRRRVALFPRFDVDWDPIDVDLVLVAHEALVDDAIARGASAARVSVCGPIAPEGWAPLADRATERAALGLAGDASIVVVRAAALDPDDLAPALVQLSLVRGGARWLFDVGADAALARALRQRVRGYGLDAHMFADGPDAPRLYGVADVVLGRLHGPEAVRALAVGASLVTVAPRRDQLRLAHVVERAGLAAIADASATLAVTLDAALRAPAIAAGRAAALALDVGASPARAATFVRQLVKGELGAAAPTGLPVGLERIGEDAPSAPRPAPAKDDLDTSVDEELAALREKLGL